jgi:hypothetical protein
MTNPARGLGHIPSPFDARDVPLSALLGASVSPPSSDLLRPHVVGLLVQGGTEGCCGWSFVDGLWARWNYLASLEGRPRLAQPSPLFPWWLARQVDGNQRLNLGTYVRNVYRQVRAFGIAPERDWPSTQAAQLGVPDGVNAPGFATQPDQLALTSAYDQRFPLAYYRIPDNDRQAGFQRALSQGYPVQFGTPVSRAFLALREHEPVKPPDRGVAMAGGHSMTAIWYDERGVYGPNNWDDLWGNAGWFALSWDYVDWIGTSDCWVIDCGLPPASWPVLEAA